MKRIFELICTVFRRAKLALEQILGMHHRIAGVEQQGESPVSSQYEAVRGDSGTATLHPPGIGRGVFRVRPADTSAQGDVTEGGRSDANAEWRPFPRKVGARYSLQAFLNSVPMLAVDLGVLLGTIAALRFLSRYFLFDAPVDISSFLLPIGTGFVIMNFELGLYPGVRLSPVEEMRRLAVSITCMFVVWSFSIAMIATTLRFNTWFLLGILYVACLITLPISRNWMRHWLGKYTNWGIPAIICGDDAAAVRVYHWLTQHHHLGLRPVGVIGDPAGLGADANDDWYAGPWTSTIEVAEKRNAFWAVVVPSENQTGSISSLIADYLYAMPQVHVLSELTGVPDHWNPQQLDGLSGIHLQQNLMLPLPQLTKRCFDLIASIAGTILLLPLFFYLAVAVKMSSRGPIFYSQERIGRYGRRFQAWKFRTMFQNSDLVLDQYLEENPELKEEWARDHKLRYDPRITRIGRFLRKTSLDELPQLWNVIRGDMSLVGPRPIVTKEIGKYGVYFGLYTMVKPGITGLWQVSGRNNTTYDERVQLDAYYVRNWSPWMDIYLLLKTVRIVLFAKGAY